MAERGVELVSPQGADQIDIQANSSQPEKENDVLDQPSLAADNAVIHPSNQDQDDLLKSIVSLKNQYRFAAQQARIQFAGTIGFACFAVLSVLSVLIDTIMIGFGTSSPYIDIQFYVFIAYTILLGVYHIVLAIQVDISTCFASSPASQSSPTQPIRFTTKLWITLDGPQFWDYVAVILGWIFLGVHMPGIAALRCYRIIRQLWHFDNYYRWLCAGTSSEKNAWVQKLYYLALHCRQVIRYFDKIGVELFTIRSRGGVAILTIYFFSTYIFAVLFWLQLSEVETTRGTPCDSLSHCYITIMRLSVLDEAGLDYMSAVQENPKYSRYTILLIIYVVFVSVILMSGLIGAFGYGLVLSIRAQEKQVHVIGSKGTTEENMKSRLLPDPFADRNPVNDSVNIIGYQTLATQRPEDEVKPVPPDSSDTARNVPALAPQFRSFKANNVKQIAVSQKISYLDEKTEDGDAVSSLEPLWKAPSLHVVNTARSSSSVNLHHESSSAATTIVQHDAIAADQVLSSLTKDIKTISSQVFKMMQEIGKIKEKLSEEPSGSQ